MVPDVSRTNIDIDDRLVAEVIRRYRLASKREAVELALRRLVSAPLSREQALALEGSGWEIDLAEMRRLRLQERGVRASGSRRAAASAPPSPIPPGLPRRLFPRAAGRGRRR